MNLFTGLLATLLLLCSSTLMAAPEVHVQGLFAGRAVLNIDGNVQLLKEGDESPEGVKLISANTDGAILMIDGERVQLSLSGSIGSSFAEPEKKELRLNPGRGGHYITRARLNGKSVEVMVDTGATLVAMSSRHAMELGIDISRGQDSYMSTAAGVVGAKLIHLDSVSVGGITRRSVRAAVNEGDFPEIILLGNSFLSGLDMRVEAGVLILTQNF